MEQINIPVPGGPNNNKPRGGRLKLRNSSGLNSGQQTTSCTLFLANFKPAISSHFTLGRRSIISWRIISTSSGATPQSCSSGGSSESPESAFDFDPDVFALDLLFSSATGGMNRRREPRVLGRLGISGGGASPRRFARSISSRLWH